MKWNDGKERKKFEKEQERLRKVYEAAGMTEEQIKNMYDFDLSLYKKRRINAIHMKSKHGDTFKALYEGQDIRNNHSNSDMALMNRLAFWCNGDKEQMLRIFESSGLYRPEKSQDYYECTVIKAIRDTYNRFQPQEYQPKAPVSNSNNNGKR